MKISKQIEDLTLREEQAFAALQSIKSTLKDTQTIRKTKKNLLQQSDPKRGHKDETELNQLKEKIKDLKKQVLDAHIALEKLRVELCEKHDKRLVTQYMKLLDRKEEESKTFRNQIKEIEESDSPNKASQIRKLKRSYEKNLVKREVRMNRVWNERIPYRQSRLISEARIHAFEFEREYGKKLPNAQRLLYHPDDQTVLYPYYLVPQHIRQYCLEAGTKLTDDVIDILQDQSGKHTFNRHAILADGDCGYSALGVKRNDAIRLLKDNLSSIKGLLRPAIQEQLLNQKFIDWLSKNGSLPDELDKAFRDYKAASKAAKLNAQIIDTVQSFASKKHIARAYIDFDLAQKEVDHGWAHPSVLQAIAQLNNIELKIWTLNPTNKLIPHSTFHEVNTGADKKVSVLFTDDHFDRLELAQSNDLAQASTTDGKSDTSTIGVTELLKDRFYSSAPPSVAFSSKYGSTKNDISSAASSSDNTSAPAMSNTNGTVVPEKTLSATVKYQPGAQQSKNLRAIKDKTGKVINHQDNHDRQKFRGKNLHDAMKKAKSKESTNKPATTIRHTEPLAQKDIKVGDIGVAADLSKFVDAGKGIGLQASAATQHGTVVVEAATSGLKDTIGVKLTYGNHEIWDVTYGNLSCQLHGPRFEFSASLEKELASTALSLTETASLGQLKCRYSNPATLNNDVTIGHGPDLLVTLDAAWVRSLVISNSKTPTTNKTTTNIKATSQPTNAAKINGNFLGKQLTKVLSSVRSKVPLQVSWGVETGLPASTNSEGVTPTPEQIRARIDQKWKCYKTQNASGSGSSTFFSGLSASSSVMDSSGGNCSDGPDQGWKSYGNTAPSTEPSTGSCFSSDGFLTCTHDHIRMISP